MKKYWTWWVSLSVHLIAVSFIVIHFKKDHKEAHHHGEHVHIDIESSRFVKKEAKHKVLATEKNRETKALKKTVDLVESGVVKEDLEEATITYSVYLRSVLNKKKSYPIRAKRLGDEGTVIVELELNDLGLLTNLFIKKSSGSKTLDQTALNLVKTSAPFKKPPNFLSDLTFNVSLEWHL